MRARTWVLPTVAVLGLLSIYPLLFAIEVSLRTPAGHGFSNFTRLVRDQFFLVALAQTLVYTAGALVISLRLGCYWRSCSTGSFGDGWSFVPSC